MVDRKTIASVLAVVTVVAYGAFAVGASALAARYGGLWAAVTTAAFLMGFVAVVLLYAFGELDREQGRQDRLR